MSFAAVQKHVSVLEGAGLVTKRQHGRERLVHANPDTLQRIQSLLQSYEQIWRDRVPGSTPSSRATQPNLNATSTST